MRSRTNCASVAVAAVVLVCACRGDALAQRRGEFGRSYGDPNGFFIPNAWAGNTPYDGRFTFARIKYRGGGRGAGWAHDYPRAESHFMQIIRSITSIRPFVEAG